MKRQPGGPRHFSASRCSRRPAVDVEIEGEHQTRSSARRRLPQPPATGDWGIDLMAGDLAIWSSTDVVPPPALNHSDLIPR
jgi:hypothetical protein